VCASVAFSRSFTCATPFAALSTAAVLNLNPRDAVVLTGAVWVANQFVGYTILRPVRHSKRLERRHDWSARGLLENHRYQIFKFASEPIALPQIWLRAC
jgi:hypothetical protein